MRKAEPFIHFLRPFHPHPRSLRQVYGSKPNIAMPLETVGGSVVPVSEKKILVRILHELV